MGYRLPQVVKVDIQVHLGIACSDFCSFQFELVRTFHSQSQKTGFKSSLLRLKYECLILCSQSLDFDVIREVYHPTLILCIKQCLSNSSRQMLILRVLFALALVAKIGGQPQVDKTLSQYSDPGLSSSVSAFAVLSLSCSSSSAHTFSS